ncbi:MAG: PHP domain-containing protein [Peptococcaceae bacterium]|nr:PHP domain-containing protein [Peptococcaceae bacterium]MDH7524121.1 PHP domain-containing protein [Peptococcaceae bacterium]
MSFTRFFRENNSEEKMDLHVHTSASDGLYSPAQVVELARKKNLKYLAITDHDTTAGLFRLKDANSDPFLLQVIPGIELSAEYCRYEVHILGYYIDIFNPELQNKLEELAAFRELRIEKMVGKLNKAGYKLSLDDVRKKAAGSASAGRPHVALALVEKGYVKNMEEAFNRLLNPGCPGYVSRCRLSPFQAIGLVKTAGGVPVLAHPGLGFPFELLEPCMEAGLRGIEAFYPLHTREMEEYCSHKAEEHGLIITGGSDFHGHEPGDINNLGAVFVPPGTISSLKKEAGISG